MQDLLNLYREKSDRQAMDYLYDRMEQVLQAMKQEDKLLNALKGHLEVKILLEDVYGESSLLDRIGTLCHQRGDMEASRRYYEENLRLKASLGRVESIQ